MTPTQIKRKKIKKTIHDLLDQEKGVMEIVEYLNSNGIRTIRGHLWTEENVYWQMRDYKGRLASKPVKSLDAPSIWKNLVLEIIASNLPVDVQKEIIKRLK